MRLTVPQSAGLSRADPILSWMDGAACVMARLATVSTFLVRPCTPVVSC